MLRISPTHVFGSLTLAYGLYTLARPSSLIDATQLDGVLHRRGAQLIGVRDTISGLALMFTPAGPPRRIALATRIGCDITDIIGFGVVCPPATKAKALIAAGGWAVAGLTILGIDMSAPVRFHR
ncbi:hypothetical protein KEM60_00714 [Austwickia sp. TVS 96-490-7B]|uniref:hypothetical protein n=1 Tax=Austwickia sp. TVS 96-490-7B TaxID=2830843 RepID=UPI001C55EB0F|nr:hypothetical protein [Austwickia sp. TVS 96-490-7B]MBW3084526.1 hypothetical protein [Austwickia sp. TVS 96-490-7B]